MKEGERQVQIINEQGVSRRVDNTSRCREKQNTYGEVSEGKLALPFGAQDACKSLPISSTKLRPKSERQEELGLLRLIDS